MVVQACDLHRHSAPLKKFKPLAALRSAHTVLPVCLVKQLKCLCKMFTKFAAKFTHTYIHTHTHTRCSLSSFIVTLSLTRRTACTHAQFSRRSSTTNVYSQTGQMEVCCQTLTLGELRSHSVLCFLIGALFKTFCPFLNTPRVILQALSQYVTYYGLVVTLWTNVKRVGIVHIK
jgi:hypothetical protein